MTSDREREQMESIDVIIADDHDLFIEGLTALLEEAPHIRFIATASNGVEAVACAAAHPEASLIIMDISMPVMDGIRATREIRKQKISTPILGLTQNDDGGSVTRAVRAGMDGYVLKTARREEFITAIETVAGGGQFYSDRAKDILLFSIAGHQKETPEVLTDREKEILQLIAAEMTTNEIGEKLFISPYTVETHRKNLIRKLGVRNVAGLVRYAFEHGLIDE